MTPSFKSRKPKKLKRKSSKRAQSLTRDVVSSMFYPTKDSPILSLPLDDKVTFTVKREVKEAFKKVWHAEGHGICDPLRMYVYACLGIEKAVYPRWCGLENLTINVSHEVARRRRVLHRRETDIEDVEVLREEAQKKSLLEEEARLNTYFRQVFELWNSTTPPLSPEAKEHHMKEAQRHQHLEWAKHLIKEKTL